MSTATRTTAQALRRLSFTFASDGSHAACLAAAADGGWYPETWRLPVDGPAEPTALSLPGNRSENLRSQLVSLPDGRVLVCRHDGDRHSLITVSAPADGELHATESLLAVLRMPGLRLLPLPGGPRTAEEPVAVALGTDTRPMTTVWLVAADGSEPRRVAEITGLHGGGVWLDRTGQLLALDRVSSGVVKSVVLDLTSGRVTPLLEIAEGSNDRLVLFDPDTHFAMVRSDAPGADRLGWGTLGGSEPLRFPECLHVPGMFLRPIALAPVSLSTPASAGTQTSATAQAEPAPRADGLHPEADGPRVALQIDRGAASALALWQPSGGRLDPLPVPPGRLGAVGHWSTAGLRMPYSAPHHPAALATLDVDTLLGLDPSGAPALTPVPLPLQLAPLGAASTATPFTAGPFTAGPAGSAAARTTTQEGTREPVGESAPARSTPARLPHCSPPGWRLDASAAPGDGGRWHPAQSLELAGPAGPIEAVVYGGDAWLSSPHLVVALHGGPADAWRLEFDPALQRMAAAGLAVVAPNQRGSTGYGLEHAMAIRGAWGGPDLDDILYLLDGLSGQRAALGLEAPALFGVSYGAFLALLVAAHAPAEQISRCAVVAPFLSGTRLLAEAAAPVRALTTRLGGSDRIEDARGPRDVLQLGHRLTAPLLIVHGDRDEVVPVSQSRSLRHELLRIGRIEGADFRYVEAAGAGHEVLAEEGGAVLHELLAAFLRTGRPT
ncbi:alpha/beta fold hydrolase [Kitasatospora sp. GP82]|uniref:alpha/beta hydrolase family protein n=1 Tax=Kitasatospora sp. GP82 TaxID=3035089 RepID=UPI002476F18A|nr:alpha/beta fold hydrolase [Kitasatospora sp. GP82]MDH6126823.1 pimeloyl-ACP methyl ester carboxylesterase [Kitasatospora sp. GP82]